MNLLKPIRSLLGGKQPAQPATTPGPAPSADPSCEEVGVQHLWSDQPNALKFQVGASILPLGERRGYASVAEAAESPLAQALFQAGGVASVELEAASLTVLLNADADMDDLHKRLPGMIRKFFSAGGSPLASPTNGGAKRYKFGFRQATGRPRDEQMRIVQELFDTEVNPAVASHGGFFTLLDIQDNKVYVELGGGCQGCGMANVTLRQGVEARLAEVLPEMEALIDQTDHASGSNPFYQASKK